MIHNEKCCFSIVAVVLMVKTVVEHPRRDNTSPAMSRMLMKTNMWGHHHHEKIGRHVQMQELTFVISYFGPLS